jgi:hypothetical protein
VTVEPSFGQVFFSASMGTSDRSRADVPRPRPVWVDVTGGWRGEHDWRRGLLLESRWVSMTTIDGVRRSGFTYGLLELAAKTPNARLVDARDLLTDLVSDVRPTR